jgi:hypothetical protein
MLISRFSGGSAERKIFPGYGFLAVPECKNYIFALLRKLFDLLRMAKHRGQPGFVLTVIRKIDFSERRELLRTGGMKKIGCFAEKYTVLTLFTPVIPYYKLPSGMCTGSSWNSKIC